MRINSEKLLRLRKERGLTQEQVAQGARVSLSTYRRYESGQLRSRVATSRVDMHENLRDLALFFDLERLEDLLIPDDRMVEPPPPPFLVHRPLDRPDQFYGRAGILRTLFGWWQQAPLTSVVLIGPRVSGKTSLLRHLVHLAGGGGLRPDQDAPWLPQPGRLRVLVCDFTDPRLCRPAGLLRHLSATLCLPAEAGRELDSFIDAAMAAVRGPTLVLFDHLEAVLPPSGAGDLVRDALWDGLRALTCNYTGGQLAFVGAAQRVPCAPCCPGDRAWSFFSLFRTLVLGPLSREEALALMTRSPLPFPEGEVEWLLHASGRWPRLLQIGCDHLLRALLDGQGRAAPGWREEALREMAPFLQSEDDEQAA